MKKGDLKKQEIIRTAETLFCRNGYEATGVQDILDALHTSKGSFYHHFESKEALLEEICRIRVAGAAEKRQAETPADASPLEKVNLLLSGMIPFNGEKVTFLLMLLPVFRLQEGIRLKDSYSKELAGQCFTPLADALEQGTAAGTFSCRDAAAYAEMALLLVNHMWMRICDLILENEETGSMTDPAELLEVTCQHRLALERLLCAPYGTINLLRLEDLQAITEQIHLHWKQA